MRDHFSICGKSRLYGYESHEDGKPAHGFACKMCTKALNPKKKKGPQVKYYWVPVRKDRDGFKQAYLTIKAEAARHDRSLGDFLTDMIMEMAKQFGWERESEEA